jgi:hypothetical protein
MKNTIFVISVLIIGILLFGCASQQVSHTGEDNVNVQPDVTAQPNVTSQPDVTVQPEKNVTVNPGGLEFSLPSEIPIAYVGTPYLYSFSQLCSGGKAPYSIVEESKTNYGYIKGVTYSESGILNFTPKRGDEGQYILEVCVSDSTTESRYSPSCKNTTLYIMSDTVTVKGEGELTHYLLLQVASDVEAADFAVPERYEDAKNISTRYVPAANFSPLRASAEVPASSQCGTDIGLGWCGAGSHTEVEATASATGASMTAEGSAPCGKSYGSVYDVDYYHAGFYTVGDYVISNSNNNIDLALNITNTGTVDKAIDVYLNVSSELDSGSQHYFKPAAASAEAFIGYKHVVSVPNANPGEILVNSTVLRILVRPGSHWIYIGGMKDSVDNTNMASCPSFVKASSSVSIIIVPADMSDGKKAVGRIYSSPKGSDVLDVTN